MRDERGRNDASALSRDSVIRDHMARWPSFRTWYRANGSLSPLSSRAARWVGFYSAEPAGVRDPIGSRAQAGSVTNRLANASPYSTPTTISSAW